MRKGCSLWSISISSCTYICNMHWLVHLPLETQLERSEQKKIPPDLLWLCKWLSNKWKTSPCCCLSCTAVGRLCISVPNVTKGYMNEPYIYIVILRKMLLRDVVLQLKRHPWCTRTHLACGFSVPLVFHQRWYKWLNCVAPKLDFRW